VHRVDATADATVEHSDADLLAAIRAGDDTAYAELWTRHQAAARRMARQIAPPGDVDDLVSESYYRVLRAVKTGGGPQDAFRPYLFSTMRRFAIDTARSYRQRVKLTGEPADLEVEPAASAADVAAVNAEQHAAWRAWASLPEASRAVLWHVVVERQTSAEIAPILGTSPNGVALRAGRAKERLRQAFLQQYLAATDDEECRETRRRLGAYVRDALSSRDRAAVDEHLARCEPCRAALLEIDDVNDTLRAVIAPIILGGALAAGHYFSSGSSAADAASLGVDANGKPAPGHPGTESSAPPGRSHRFWPSGSKTAIWIAAAIAALIAAVLVVIAVIPGSPKRSQQAAPNATASVSGSALGLGARGSGGSTSGPGNATVTSAPGTGGGQASGGAPLPGAAGRPTAAASPGSTAAAGPTGPPAGGHAATAIPPAGQQPTAPSPVPAAPAPAPSSAPPVTVRETVAVAIPDPAASVTLSVPVRWTIEEVEAAGIAVTGCTGLHTTTVRCLNVGVGPTLAVGVQGVRATGAMLHVVTVGLGGGVHDYRL
jgi:RNA polymerase sigma factor (sigma-70 family)